MSVDKTRPINFTHYLYISEGNIKSYIGVKQSVDLVKCSKHRHRAEHFPNDLATRPRLYLNRNLTESTLSSLYHPK